MRRMTWRRGEVSGGCIAEIVVLGWQELRLISIIILIIINQSVMMESNGNNLVREFNTDRILIFVVPIIIYYNIIIAMVKLP